MHKKNPVSPLQVKRDKPKTKSVSFEQNVTTFQLLK